MARIRIQDLNISPLQKVCIKYEIRNGSISDPGSVITRTETTGLYGDINPGIYTNLYVYEVAAKGDTLIVYLEQDCFEDMKEENNNEAG